MSGKTTTPDPDLLENGQEVCASEDPQEVAEAAGLCYVTDALPGIRRKRQGKHFRYFAPDGAVLRDAAELDRIQALHIPPAWDDVWICSLSQGHLQATGRDAKGRKQYRYHNRWRVVRDEAKYEHLVPFGESLPHLREQVDTDLHSTGLTFTRVLATVTRLLDLTLIRVGNEEYVQSNQSYGLTTLRTRHAAIRGDEIHLRFRGKRGLKQDIDLHERELARIVKRCRELPGQELFQYLDDEGGQRSITSSDVNAYLQAITGQAFTAKDFRTWGGTVIVLHSLRETGSFEQEAQAKKQVLQAIREAADHLGNTPAICRKCYVHPSIVNAYLDGSLLSYLHDHPRRVKQGATWELHPDEALLLDVLRHLQTSEA